MRIKELLSSAVACSAFATSGLTAATSAQDDIWTRDKMTGDWGGFRTTLAEEYGLSLDLRNTQYYQGVTGGGADHGATSPGLWDFTMHVDGGKAGLWEGLFVDMKVQKQYGQTMADDVGPFGLTTTPLLYPLPDYNGVGVTSLYATQMFNEHFGIVGGKLNSVDLQSMFLPYVDGGQGGFSNLNLLSVGMPWFRYINLSMIGGGALLLTDDGQVRGGVIVVDTQNSTTTSGLDDAFDNGVSYLAVWKLFFDVNELPGYVTFAFGGSTAEYSSLDESDWGFIPGEGIEGETKDEMYTGTIYYTQTLWQDSGDKAKQLISNSGVAVNNGNPNFAKWTAYSVIEAHGMLFGREKDRTGIGAYYVGMDSDYKELTSDLGEDTRDTWGAEVYYNYEVTPWMHLTGDVQYIQSGSPDLSPTVIMGLRMVTDF